MTEDHIPPGVMACNPFDLMYTPSITWVGQVTPQPKGVRLLKFLTPIDGLRAGMKDAHTKVYVHRYDTIETFVDVFAPDNENDTAAYIADLYEWSGWKRGHKISLITVADNVLWAKLIVRQEVGFMDEVTKEPWYTDAQYETAAKMALGLA